MHNYRLLNFFKWWENLKVTFSESTWRMQMTHSGDNCKTQLLSRIDRFFFSVQSDLIDPRLREGYRVNLLSNRLREGHHVVLLSDLSDPRLREGYHINLLSYLSDHQLIKEYHVNLLRNQRDFKLSELTAGTFQSNSNRLNLNSQSLCITIPLYYISITYSNIPLNNNSKCV